MPQTLGRLVDYKFGLCLVEMLGISQTCPRWAPRGISTFWSRSVVDPSPRLSAGATSKTSCGFKTLHSVRMVLAIFGVV